jgi:hypothetical protein
LEKGLLTIIKHLLKFKIKIKKPLSLKTSSMTKMIFITPPNFAQAPAPTSPGPAQAPAQIGTRVAQDPTAGMSTATKRPILPSEAALQRLGIKPYNLWPVL